MITTLSSFDFTLDSVLFLWFGTMSCNILSLLLYVGVQEWPEEVYPPYANGPGYIISSDIAKFIVSEFRRHKLRVNTVTFVFLSVTC